jgi:hypothetical protein
VVTQAVLARAPGLGGGDMNGEGSNVDTLGEGTVQRAQRCPSCGGLNPPQAQWCGQCHARFEQPEAPAPAPARPDAPVEQAIEAAPAPPAPVAPRAATTEGGVATEGLPFRVTEEGITWTCSVCETVNDLDRSICQVCGAPFARTVLPEEEKPARDPNMTALISLFMPGAGHAYLGLWGQGIARAVVSLWVIMVVFVAALQRGAAASNLVMGVFGFVAVAFWGIAAHDSYREARNERSSVILTNKVFFYTVLGLLLLLVALLMSAMVKAQSS